MRQFATAARCSQRLGGIRFAYPLAIAVPKKTAKTGKSSCDGRASVSAFVQPSDVGSQDSDFDVLWLWHGARRFLQEFDDMGQVIGVRLNSQCGRIAFDSQVIQKCLDGSMHGKVPEAIQKKVGKSSVSISASSLCRSRTR